MKKSYLIIVIYFYIMQIGFSQSNGVTSFDIPAKNTLKFNKYLINPAFSFVREEFPILNLYSKSQWTTFEGAPQNYFINYTSKILDNSAFSLGAFKQDFGVLSTTGGILNFAQNVELEEDSNLTFGLNLSVYKSGLNRSKIVSTVVDPLLLGITDNTILSLSPGINYGNEMLDFGVSANNVVLYNFTNSKAVAGDPNKSFQGHIMYTGFISSDGYFDESKFVTLFRAETKKAKTEFNANFMFEKPTLGWIQGGYNNIFGISAGIGANITKNISVGYNFGKGLGDISVFGNTHEFLLAYIFNPSEDSTDGNEVIYTKPVAVVDPKIEAAKQQAAADAEAKIVADKEKARLQKLAYEKALAEVKIKADAAAVERLISDKAKAEALKLANEKNSASAKAAAEAKAKADAQRLADEQVANANKAKADKENFEATRIANQKALAKAKADAAAAAKIADAKEKADAANAAKDQAAADAKTRAEGEAKAKIELDKIKAAAKLQADQDKAEAARLAKEKADADAKVKGETDKEKLAALKLANDKIAADAKIKAEADALAKREADKLKAASKAAADKEKADAIKLANAKTAADAKAKAEADALVKAEADKVKAVAKADADKAKAEAAKIAADKAAADASTKAAADKEKADALKLANAKTAADAKAKAEADALVKTEADKVKAAAKADADKARAEAAKIAADKVAEDAKAKIAAAKEASDKSAADAKAKADDAARAKADAAKAASDKAAADAKAKADAAKEANEKAANAAKAKADADAKVKADAAKAASDKAAADAKAKAEADAKAKADAAKAAEPKSEDDKELDYFNKILKDNSKSAKALLSRLDSTVVKKANDLKELKEENDLSDKGIVKAPKAFQSAAAANKALENLKVDLNQSIKTQSEFLNQIISVRDQRLIKVPSKADPTNVKFNSEIESLRADLEKTKKANADALAKLDQIKTDIDVEKKRRIKRASFESGQGRFEQDRAALKRIKESTSPTAVALKSIDFDYGDVQENTQILKKIENTESGFYLILAVHSDANKRDQFITKVVSSGVQNIDFFFDVNTGKYYIYSKKYDNLNDTTIALESKGNKPYNGKMFVVKIEN